MLAVPVDLESQFSDLLAKEEISQNQSGFFRKWLRYYLHFCHKYMFSPEASESLGSFLGKLREKRQTPPQVLQAAEAIRLYYKLLEKVPFTPVERTDSREPKGETSDPGEGERKGAAVSPKRMERFSSPGAKREEKSPFPTNKPAKDDYANVIVPGATLGKVHVQEIAGIQGNRSEPPSPISVKEVTLREQVISGMLEKSDVDKLIPSTTSALTPVSQTGASWVAEYAALAGEIKVRQYSLKTLKAYKLWVRHFQTFTRSKSPGFIDNNDVKEFLTFLAVRQNVSASTQNQAFNALLFFFRHVLHKEFGKIDGAVRAKNKRHIPVVLSREEIEAVLDKLAPHMTSSLNFFMDAGCGFSSVFNSASGA